MLSFASYDHITAHGVDIGVAEPMYLTKLILA